MEDTSSVRQLVAAARSRILLICPDCGQEHLEFADKLRGLRNYPCRGDGCGFRFDLNASPSPRFVLDIAGAWRRFCTTFTAARRAGAAGDSTKISRPLVPLPSRAQPDR
jgi:predicted RNA-binding Zn-ribbon protein involved in translation (DUF1610 family)